VPRIETATRISLIQSVFAAFGSRVIAGDTGVIMIIGFAASGLDPSKANSLKSGKRPAHTLNTYMVFKGGEFFAVGGSRARMSSHKQICKFSIISST